MKTLTLKISKTTFDESMFIQPVYEGHNFKDVFHNIGIGDVLKVVDTDTGETVQSAIMYPADRPRSCSDCIFRAGAGQFIAGACKYVRCAVMVPMTQEAVLERL